MSRTIEQMQRQIELALNEISADQTVFRVTLQCFLLNMARLRPELMPSMKAQVLATISQTAPSENPTEQQEVERRTKLTLMRAEQLFHEIEGALGTSGIAPEKPASH